MRFLLPARCRVFINLCAAAVLLGPPCVAAPGASKGEGIQPGAIYQRDWNDLNKNGKKDLYEDPGQPPEARADDLLRRMTLEEKAGQLAQGFFPPVNAKCPFEPYPAAVRTGNVGSYIYINEGPDYSNRLQRVAIEETRLGIPLLFGCDIIHGYRTLFPVTLGLACAFDPSLLERAQAVAAHEARAGGVQWVFAPMSDLARDPRWGRVVETCGEDPYLTSLCIAAEVKGLQGGASPGTERVAACLKHFAGYSAVVGGRDYNYTEVPESILRSSHLPPFRAGVRAGAQTVMSSFNTVDGVPSVANRHLLTEILRGEWGFRGFTVSDWAAVNETISWGYAKDKAEAARLALAAGTDMDMVSGVFQETLVREVRAGHIPRAQVDQAARRVLLVKFKLGLFDHPYAEPKNFAGALLRPEALALARECVAKSAVLLKNEGPALPLSKDVKKVALIGPFGDDPAEMNGSWSGWGHAGDVVTLARGLRAKLAAGAVLSVVKGCLANTLPRTKTLTDGSIVPDASASGQPSDLNKDEAVQAAQGADAVILALGEACAWTGENASRSQLGLTGRQQELFDAVAATGKPVISVIFSGRPLAIPAVVEKSAAVIYAWQPGTQAGNGLADLLFGDVPPSARLSMSVPADVGQVPVFYNRYKTGRPEQANTNYRDRTRDPLFWFGHGLTYTTFDYGAVRIVPAGNGKPAVALATVTNSGQREGTEVVQLYIRQMACSQGIRPEQELRGFQRVALKPGEKAEVRFPLGGDVLGYDGRDGKWHFDKGDYSIWIAPHAQTGTPATYTQK